MYSSVPVTAGQPRQAIELLTLTHSNTKHAVNYVEHGLVSTVTTLVRPVIRWTGPSLEILQILSST
jgi:hypothetical protein